MASECFQNVAREELYQAYSDFYKELYGIRPRWVAEVFFAASLEEVEEMFERLHRELWAQEEERKEQEQQRVFFSEMRRQAREEAELLESIYPQKVYELEVARGWI